MKKIIKELYDIDIEIMIKLSSTVYKIKAKNEEYILKYLDDVDDLEATYSRLELLNLSSFSIPLKNVVWKIGSWSFLMKQPLCC